MEQLNGQTEESDEVNTMTQHNEPAYTIKCRYACAHCGTLASNVHQPAEIPNGTVATTECERCGSHRWLKLATPVMAPPPDNSTPLRVSYWSLQRPRRGDPGACEAPGASSKPCLSGAFDVVVHNTGKVWPQRLGQITTVEGRIVGTTDGKRYELGDVEQEYLDTIEASRAREQIRGPNPIPASAVLTSSKLSGSSGGGGGVGGEGGGGGGVFPSTCCCQRPRRRFRRY